MRKGSNAAGVLNSWKEIACYLDRGVRTVQRWETELALPVRRHHKQNRSGVIAFTSELDEWLKLSAARRKAQQRSDQSSRNQKKGQHSWHFLMVEISAGFTYAMRAFSAEPTQRETILRNLNNTAKAYQCVMKFRERVPMDEPQRAQLESALRCLESAMKALQVRLN